MARGWNGNNGQLMGLASALSLLLAQGQEAEQIGRMAAFFTLLGDSLALLALQAPEDCLPPPACQGPTSLPQGAK